MNTRTLSIRLTGYLIFFSSFDCSAQNTYPVMSMDVATEAVGNHLTADSLPILTDTTIFDVGMNLNLYDTTNIPSPGASDVFSRNFTFDVSGSLGSGISYLRDEYAIHLGLGNLQQMLSYYSQVRIQRTDGSYNTAVVFNR